MANITSQIEEFSQKIIQNLEHVIVGKRTTIEQVVIALLCQGHVLIEDVPGVGKTMLARSLAKSLGCTFSRIQFTPDMLPSDITGVSIYNQKTMQFEFRPGPIMAQIILVDEINRATPKTQSALLEAMEERQISVDGKTHLLPTPFMVIGTQNPIEYEGTFPLPEAQLDRFLIRIKLGYPEKNEEIKILEIQKLNHPIISLNTIVSEEEVLKAQKTIKEVYVSERIMRYIVDLTHATRGSPDVFLGSSPRGSLALYRAGQARAAIYGRDFVLPDDIKILANPILSHRIVLDPSARLKNISSHQIIEEVLNSLPVPGGDFNVR
jgi:MoxR-like ATPase